MLFATVLALAAAALHASWNLLVKTSGDRDLTAWGQFLVGGTLLLPALAVTGLPPRDVAPQLIASGLVHILYVRALVSAYRHGDFSMTYPLARGSGALLAAVGGSALFGDDLSIGSWVGASIVAGGLLLLVDRDAPTRALLAAASTGVLIATYTLIDASGARDADGFSYGVALTFLAGLFMTVDGAARGRVGAFVGHLRSEPARVAASGVFLTVAYSLVMVAVNHAPVGYVAMLRESSIVLGAAAGWLLLGEQLGGRRLICAGIITAGMAVLVLSA